MIFLVPTESQSSQAVKAEEGLLGQTVRWLRENRFVLTIQDSTDELVSLASAYFKKPETESDIGAKEWAFKLSTLPADQRQFAEKIMNNTLFEAEI